ncbi:MAG: hypothetical protein AB8G96_02435 [Phycisphaerales bacterium]
MLALALVGGCAVTDARRTAPLGAPAGPSTLSQIVPGETTAGWVMAVLGEPDRIEPAGADPLAGTAATLVYRSGTVRTGGGNLLVFSAATGVEDAVETRIAVAGGRVSGVEQVNADRRLTALERAALEADEESADTGARDDASEAASAG